MPRDDLFIRCSGLLSCETVLGLSAGRSLREFAPQPVRDGRAALSRGGRAAAAYSAPAREVNPGSSFCLPIWIRTRRPSLVDLYIFRLERLVEGHSRNDSSAWRMRHADEHSRASQASQPLERKRESENVAGTARERVAAVPSF